MAKRYGSLVPAHVERQDLCRTWRDGRPVQDDSEGELNRNGAAGRAPRARVTQAESVPARSDYRKLAAVEARRKILHEL